MLKEQTKLYNLLLLFAMCLSDSRVVMRVYAQRNVKCGTFGGKQKKSDVDGPIY